MKILTIIENYDPFVLGGAEVTVESYIKYIHLEYDVEYLVLTGKHTKVKNYKEFTFVVRTLVGVEGKSVNKIIELFNILFNAINLIKILIQYKPDIVEFVPNNYSLYPLIYLATFIKVPIVVSVHNSSFSHTVESVGGWLKFIKTNIIRRFKAPSRKVITISKYMKDRLIKAGFSSDNINVLYNPIENVYDSIDTGNYAVFASRLIEEKGVECVLKAFAEIKSIDLFVYGEGTEQSIVEEYTKAYPNIKYYGKVSEEEIIDSIKNCFCIVAHPIYEEPYGRFLVHSFSALKPLVCTYSGAVPEIIMDHHNGLLIHKKDVIGLIKAVEELKRDIILYKKIVSNLKKERNSYSIHKLAKQRLNVYQETICK